MARPRRLYRSATAREKCRRIFRAQALPMWTRSSRDRPRRRDHSLLPLDDVPLRVVRLVHESGVIDRADGRNAKLRGAATGNVVLTWNSSVLQIYTTAAGGSPLAQFSRPYNGFTTTNLYVEGVAPGSNTLSWSYSEQTKCTDQIKVTILKVDLDHDLWWFNGEDPGGGYNITATLTVSPLTTGTFKWDVIAGSDKIDLNNGGADADSITATDDNTVTVKSTSPSAAAASVTKDVTVQLTYNGTPVCTFDLAVFAPHSLHHLANIDHDYAALPPPYPDYTGYWCEIKYEILDQFDRVLPYDVPWNEDFNKDGANPVSGISDYSGENWGWGPESGWSVPPSGAIDNLARPDLPGLVPPAQNVGSGTVKIDHVIGAWYVGSTTIGDGVLVLDNNKWQMYQDHGRHE